jgi:hypothetical protein
MPTKEITRPTAPAKTRRRDRSPDATVPAAEILDRLQQEREATR